MPCLHIPTAHICVYTCLPHCTVEHNTVLYVFMNDMDVSCPHDMNYVRVYLYINLFHANAVVTDVVCQSRSETVGMGNDFCFEFAATWSSPKQKCREESSDIHSLRWSASHRDRVLSVRSDLTQNTLNIFLTLSPCLYFAIIHQPFLLKNNWISLTIINSLSCMSVQVCERGALLGKMLQKKHQP